MKNVKYILAIITGKILEHEKLYSELMDKFRERNDLDYAILARKQNHYIKQEGKR